MKGILLTAAISLIASFSAIAQDKMMNSDPMMPMAGAKVEYTSLEDAQNMAETGSTVLFFYARWCPFCREDLAEIDTRLDELGGISIVVVNYDKETDLRKKYGVTYQHTYVQIDSSGNRIDLWNGGGVDGILKNTVTTDGMN